MDILDTKDLLAKLLEDLELPGIHITYKDHKGGIQRENWEKPFLTGITEIHIESQVPSKSVPLKDVQVILCTGPSVGYSWVQVPDPNEERTAELCRFILS